MTVIPSPRSKRHARIEIIPLIDIMFFLLATFVMVSLSMVKSHGVPVRLPSTATGQQIEHKDFSTISVTASGQVYIDKEEVSLAQLGLKLATRSSRSLSMETRTPAWVLPLKCLIRPARSESPRSPLKLGPNPASNDRLPPATDTPNQ